MWTEHNISIWVKKIIKEIEISFEFKSYFFYQQTSLGEEEFALRFVEKKT